MTIATYEQQTKDIAAYLLICRISWHQYAENESAVEILDNARKQIVEEMDNMAFLAALEIKRVSSLYY